VCQLDGLTAAHLLHPNIKVAVPPLTEQLGVTAFIEKMVDAFNALEFESRRAIELLTEVSRSAGSRQLPRLMRRRPSPSFGSALSNKLQASTLARNDPLCSALHNGSLLTSVEDDR